MKNYYVHIPAWGSWPAKTYGIDKKDAVARFRKQNGFLRMPKGYGIWEVIS